MPTTDGGSLPFPTELIKKIEQFQEEAIHDPQVDDPTWIARQVESTPQEVDRALAIMDAQAHLYDADEMSGTYIDLKTLIQNTFPEIFE